MKTCPVTAMNCIDPACFGGIFDGFCTLKSLNQEERKVPSETLRHWKEIGADLRTESAIRLIDEILDALRAELRERDAAAAAIQALQNAECIGGRCSHGFDPSGNESMITCDFHAAIDASVAWGPEKQDVPGGPIYRVGSSTGVNLPPQPEAQTGKWVPSEQLRYLRDVIAEGYGGLPKDYPPGPPTSILRILDEWLAAPAQEEDKNA